MLPSVDRMRAFPRLAPTLLAISVGALVAACGKGKPTDDATGTAGTGGGRVLVTVSGHVSPHPLAAKVGASEDFSMLQVAIVDPLATLAVGEDAYWDGSKFVVRQRTLSAEQQARVDAKARVVTLAQSTVGVNITALDAGQRLALVAVLLYKAGALNGDGTVKPLADWVRD